MTYDDETEFSDEQYAAMIDRMADRALAEIRLMADIARIQTERAFSTLRRRKGQLFRVREK